MNFRRFNSRDVDEVFRKSKLLKSAIFEKMVSVEAICLDVVGGGEECVCILHFDYFFDMVWIVFVISSPQKKVRATSLHNPK